MIGGKQNSIYFKFKHQENFSNPAPSKKRINYLRPNFAKPRKKTKLTENSMNNLNKKFQLFKNVDQEKKTDRKNSQVSVIQSTKNLLDSAQSKKNRNQLQEKITIKQHNVLIDKNVNQNPPSKKLKLKLNSVRNITKASQQLKSIKKIEIKNKTREKRFQTSKSQILADQLFICKNSLFKKDKQDVQSRFQKSLKKKKLYKKSVKKLQKSTQTKQKKILSLIKTKKTKEYAKQDYSSLIHNLDCKENINFEIQDIKKPIQNENLLKDFKHENFNNNFVESNIKILIQDEKIYKASPSQIKKNQTELEWRMRAVLVDWIQQVCSEYFFKRETYHYSICYLDKMFESKKVFQRDEFQLLGLTCLFLAAKMEEVYTPKLRNMLQTAKNKYTGQQVIKLEVLIYKTLQYNITPPTLNTWANWAMEMWDQFINGQMYVSFSSKKPSFKQPTDKSYILFRQLFQFIDACLLDILYLQYKNRAVVTSFMYLILGIEFEVFDKQIIAEQFYQRSDYLEDENNQFNYLFNNFLEKCFGFCLKDLLPSIQFCSTFINLKITIDYPEAAKIDQEKVLNGHFEEFLAFQTYNEYQRDYMICIRNRATNQQIITKNLKNY